MQTSIETIRLVCKLLSDPAQSHRSIARLCQVCHKTVKRIQVRIETEHLDVRTIQDNDLYRLFSHSKVTVHATSTIDWQTLHNDMQKRDMTMQLAWEEYRTINNDGISYSQYCRQYRQWRKTIKVSLRQTHRAGESIFIDFCGRTMPICDKKTGEDWKAQVFVGVCGASGYIFAVAVKSQKITDFLSAHMQMLAHINGVPKYIVTDNLKSAVIKNTKETIELNRAYTELAEHYGFIIVPARPRRPKDKAMAEVGVQIVQRWVLARLRNQVFFSLDELNQQIEHWMIELNQRITKTYTVSRTERLESIDRPALRRLPILPYAYSAWAYNQRVDDSYHVLFNGKRYSVPYQFAHRTVDVRATDDVVEVFWQRERIARHAVTSDLVTSDPAHRPDNHQFANDTTPDNMRDWARNVGIATLQFVEANLSDTRHYAAKLKSLINLKREVRQHDWQASLEAACAFVIHMKCFSVSRLRSVLKRHSFEPTQSTTKPIHHSNIRGADYYAGNTGGVV
ncbi:integrase [Formosimonas limnophila]|uniref:Integrase n=2 Tax=Formosimonas limnophila TaxID=1384487 RepID=A0A8J3CP49_9BURK|nr:integrase [Formosimonas limnophila]